MNMQTKPPATAAEQALFDSFADRSASLPGSEPVGAMRRRLMDELKASGLPNRRVEAWHYTDLRTLLREVPVEAASGDVPALAPLVEGSTVLRVANGRADPTGSLPDGLAAAAFADRLADEGVVKLLTAQGDDDAVGRINGAFVTDGLDLDLAAGATLPAPLEIQVLHGGGQAHTRFPARVGANARATVVERHRAMSGEDALTSSITDLSLGEGAEVTWIVLQEQGLRDSHFGRIDLRLGAGARLMLYVVNAGGHLVRQEIRGTVEGEGADLTMRGINLIGGDSHTDVTLSLGHEVADTTSTETVRNVVFDRARGVFQGQIRVAPQAQKTDAKMACNTLLLSDEGEFSTKPELEIFADDVQCGHGATVTDIDANHLFYLMSRGVPEKKARAMLVNAFIAEVVEELNDEGLIAALEGVVSHWLEAHG